MSTSQVASSSAPYLSFMSGFVGIFTVHLCVEIKTCQATYLSYVACNEAMSWKGKQSLINSVYLCTCFFTVPLMIDRNMFCIRTQRVSLSDDRVCMCICLYIHYLDILCVCVCVCSWLFCCLSGMLSKQLPQTRSRGIVHAGALAEGISDL